MTKTNTGEGAPRLRRASSTIAEKVTVRGADELAALSVEQLGELLEALEAELVAFRRDVGNVQHRTRARAHERLSGAVSAAEGALQAALSESRTKIATSQLVSAGDLLAVAQLWTLARDPELAAALHAEVDRESRAGEFTDAELWVGRADYAHRLAELQAQVERVERLLAVRSAEQGVAEARRRLDAAGVRS
jgi:hypothetical protein